MVHSCLCFYIRCLHTAWRVARILLLLLCLGFVLGLWVFTRLPEHQSALLNWVNSHWQHQLKLEKLETYWLGSNPTLALQKLTVHSAQQPHNSFTLNSVEVSLDLWESLWQRQWVTHQVYVHAPELNLLTDSAGQLQLQGFFLPIIPTVPPEPASPSKFENALSAWLQRTDLTLNLERLNFTLPQQAPLNLRAVSWVIEKHADNLQHWKLAAELLPPKAGRASHLGLSAALHWQDNALKNVAGQLQLQTFTAPATNLIAEFHSTAQADTWVIEVQPQIKVANHNNVLSSFRARWQATGELSLETDNLSLAWLPPYLNALALPLHLPILQTAATWQLQGQCARLQLEYHNVQDWNLQARCVQMGAHSQAAQFGISGITGTLALRPQQGSFQLENSQFTLTAPKLYRLPMMLMQMQGQLNWQRLEKYWQIKTEEIQAVERGMQIKLSGSVDLPEQAMPQLHLRAELRNGKIARVHTYLPEQRLPDTVAWLEKSLVGGEISEAYATLDGAADKLFDENTKNFIFKGLAKNAQLNFDPRYPPIHEIAATVDIVGRKLSVTAQQGRIFQSHLQHVLAEIPDLSADFPFLNITGKLEGTAQDGARYLQESPLKNNVDLEKGHVELSGAMDLELKLLIPLAKASHGEEKVWGKLNFKDLKIKNTQLGITLQQAKGILLFDDKQLNAEQLKALLFNKPVTLELKTTQVQGRNIVQVNLAGKADADFIKQRLTKIDEDFGKLPFYSHLKGETAWQLRLELPRPSPHTTSTSSDTYLYLASNLKGLSSDLPFPFQKKAEQSQNFTLTARLSETDQDALWIEYGNWLHSAFELQKGKLSRATVKLNALNPQLAATAGLTVDGSLPELSLSAWQKVFSEAPELKASRITKNISLQVNKLEILGQVFNQVKLKAKIQPEQIDAHFNSDALHGTIQFTKTTPEKISFNFKELHLKLPEKFAEAKPEKNSDPRPLPIIEGNIEQLQLDQRSLGQLKLALRPTAAGWELDNLQINHPHFQWIANGLWQVATVPQYTHLQAKVRSDDLGELLQAFGYDPPPLRGGETELAGESYWEGSPLAFSLKKLRGKLHLAIAEGQIADFEPGLGRVLGLFDLQTLPRRLILDFSDVFSQGFGFSKIIGDFNFVNGFADTQNLQLIAPAAKIEIQGRTDLTARQYDQVVTVIPHVSNTIPVVGALVGGLGVGAGVLIVQKLLQAEIEQAINYQYHITGAWEKPVITPVGGTGEE
ncbi:MAG: YhdP family protein [Thiotrichaceae bacterium]|nr:YhdP family protein [Thiotrichaceae bacterium]